jgi:hypothetical protein
MRLAQRGAQPMRRLRCGAGMGEMKDARRGARDLRARVVHQRTDFERGLQPRRRERVGAGLVSPLRAGEVALKAPN